MYLKPIVEMDIIKIIEKFKQNKSAGYDNIGNFVLKKVSSEIAKPLTMIFNLSLSTGVVPDKLKIAKVIPLYDFIRKMIQKCFLTIDLSHCYRVYQKSLKD